MVDSTKAVVVKESDGSVVPGSFYGDNVDALRLASQLVDITKSAWVPEKRGFVVIVM